MFAQILRQLHRFRAEPALTRSAFCWYLAGLGAFGLATLWFSPPYSYPYGDEGTYFSYALHPWSLISDFFEGYPPKEVVNPYNARLFLWPFSAVFAIFGFTVFGARVVVLLTALALLYFSYLLVERLSTPRQALLTVVLFSLSPAFFFYSHGVRPEGMMALFVTLCLWITLREEKPRTRTWFTVGLLSSSMLWIHYNGVLMPLVFFVALLVYDAQRNWRKVAAFLAGGLVFVVVFTLLNLLPALDTLRGYGLLPITYESSNAIPILQTLDWSRVLLESLARYAQLAAASPISRWAITLTLVVSGLAFVGLLQKSPNRRWRTVKTVLVGILLLLLFVFPNRRLGYLFYIYPALFALAIFALRTARIPDTRTLALVGALAAGYLVNNATLLRGHWQRHQDHQQVETELRSAIEHLGPAKSVRVMGTQHFHAMAADTRYRTFHSIIANGSISATVRRIKPDMVIIDENAVRFLAHVHQYQKSFRQVREQTMRELRGMGFTEQKVFVRGLHWLSLFRAPRKIP
ncbi:MAG: glycosyltransferase family 39 protein [Gammaproteobacteria bacterium]|nr:glycosyltransferase family 39 protein [Gammaproteobacteria bacterium]